MKDQNIDNPYATKEDLKNLGLDIKADMKELLEAMQIFSGTVDKQFKEVNNRLIKVESTMVTKDYLDEKLGDLRGDLTVLIRKEDNKVKALVEVLVDKKVLNKADQKKIYSLEPFAQI